MAVQTRSKRPLGVDSNVRRSGGPADKIFIALSRADAATVLALDSDFAMNRPMGVYRVHRCHAQKETNTHARVLADLRSCRLAVACTCLAQLPVGSEDRPRAGSSGLLEQRLRMRRDRLAAA